MESWLNNCAKEKGAFVISLFACDRENQPEEKGFFKKITCRGGTDATELKPIDDPGQSITIFAVPDGKKKGWVHPETPSLAKEFLE